MKIVYIAHPISNNVELNLRKIRAIVRKINLNEPDVVPFVPYYADIVSMDDHNPEERGRGIKNGHAVLRSGIVHELRVYGFKSMGVVNEMAIAQEMRIPIVDLTE